jgi:hypothetical protein
MSLPPIATQLLDPAGLGSFDEAADGLVLTTGTTAFVKTAWTQVTAGLPQALSGMLFTFMPDAFDTAAETTIDIAFGPPGSEVIVLADYFYTAPVFAYFGIMREFPIAVPANTRVSIRVAQSTAAAKTTRVFFQPIYASPLTPNNAAVTSTIISTVVGGNGAWGTPVLLTSGLPFPVRKMTLSWVGYGSQSNHIRFSTDTAGVNRVGPAVWQFSNDQSYCIPLLPFTLPINTPLYVTSNSFGTVSFALYLFG